MNTLNSERLHISIFGSRNVGKSTLVNELLDQDFSIVSNTKGTTTDPVSKAMELYPLGPIILTDTAGYDDIGELGEKRISKTKQVLIKTDIAIIIIDKSIGKTKFDISFENLIKENKIPYAIIYKDKKSIKEEVIQELIKLSSKFKTEKKILNGIAKKEDIIILVCPIDDAAPKGRIILPQQMVLKEILDLHATAIVIQPKELKKTLEILNPNLVITDSQCFKIVAKVLPENIPLTSFSILLARYKGYLKNSIDSIKAIKELKNNDSVLISEGCTHKRQCKDIGSVQIPLALKKITHKNLNIKNSLGNDFPKDLSEYSLIIHCGGCMISEKEVLYRMKIAHKQNIPFCNYGIFLAYANGILERSIKIFKNNY